MARTSVATAVLALGAIAVLTGRGAEAAVACSTGFVEFACPDDYPTCCSWPNNGVIAACCPASSQCDLAVGECIISNSSSNVTGTPKTQGGITVGVSEAAAFITFAAIGFIVALVGCAFLGFRAFIFMDARRQQRADAERQALLADDSGDEEAAAGAGEDDESEVDDEGQCNICYSRSVNCALMPCAHVATCRVCAARLDKCPICREDVARFIPFKNRLYRALPKAAAAARAPRAAAAAADDSKTEELGSHRDAAETPRQPRSARSARSDGGGSAVGINDSGDDEARRSSATQSAAAPAATLAADTDERPVVVEAADAATAAETTAEASAAAAAEGTAPVEEEARPETPAATTDAASTNGTGEGAPSA